MSGVKNDSLKPDLSLLSPFALEEIAKVMTFGAKKYSANNWRAGFAYSRLLAAVLRHIMAYQRGERLDPETNLSHLAHASCGLMMLLEFEQTGVGTNDIYWQNNPIAAPKSEIDVKLDAIEAQLLAGKPSEAFNTFLQLSAMCSKEKA